MKEALTMDRRSSRRIASFLFGAGMVCSPWLTIEHYFAANFPATIWEGSVCDLNARGAGNRAGISRKLGGRVEGESR